MPTSRSSSSSLRVGVVTGAHGTRGGLRVKLHDPASTAVRDGAHVTLGDDARFRVATAAPIPGHPGMLRVYLEGVRDRDAAQALRGREIEVAREALDPLSADEFYLADVIELPVVTGAGENLGQIVAVSTNGAQDLLEVQYAGAGGRERTWLLPVLPYFIADVRPDRVVVDLPDGFLPDDLQPDG